MIIINGEEWASKEAHDRYIWLKTHRVPKEYRGGKAHMNKIKQKCIRCKKTDFLTTDHKGNLICQTCFLSTI